MLRILKKSENHFLKLTSWLKSGVENIRVRKFLRKSGMGIESTCWKKFCLKLNY